MGGDVKESDRIMMVFNQRRKDQIGSGIHICLRTRGIEAAKYTCVMWLYIRGISNEANLFGYMLRRRT